MFLRQVEQMPVRVRGRGCVQALLGIDDATLRCRFNPVGGDDVDHLLGGDPGAVEDLADLLVVLEDNDALTEAHDLFQFRGDEDD